jgi:malate permease and related proteins
MAARRAAFLPEGTARVLDTVVVRLSLPALILTAIAEVPLGAEVLIPVAAAWGTLVLLAAVVWGVARLLRLDPVTRGTLLVVVPLGNTSFLGFPAVEALLGAGHLGYAAVYDQLGSFLGLATWAVIVASRHSPRDGGLSLRGRVQRIVAFPPFIALVVALVTRPVGLPGPVLEVAGTLGATVTPLAMLAVGLRLDLAAAAHKPAALAGGLALRMVLAPALVWAVALAVGGQGAVWETTVLQAAMPPMVTAAVIAADAGLDDRLAAALAGVGVLVAMATLPLWALLLT